MIFEFTIPGKPCGKGRPRFYNGRAITPEKTVNYETLVKLAFRQAYPRAEPIAAKAEVIAKIKAYYPIPVSASKKLQARMRAGLMKYVLIEQFIATMPTVWRAEFDTMVSFKLRRQIERIENEVR